MSEKTKELDSRILDLFSRVNYEFGNDEATARLVGMIYMSPDEVSLEELSERTGYSTASISNKTRMLVNVGLVKKVHKPGTKKAYFYMEKDMKKIMCSAFRKALDVKIRPIKEKMPEIIEEYQKEVKKGRADENNEKKLKILQNYLKDIRVIEDKMTRMVNELCQ